MDFTALIDFLEKVPSIKKGIGTGLYEDGNWWCKFQIDISHKLSGYVVQELGHVVNLVSISERLPTLFYPVSPPPYLNGGPEEFLSWIIESKENNFKPSDLEEWLKGRLPDPVDDVNEWELEEE